MRRPAKSSRKPTSTDQDKHGTARELVRIPKRQGQRSAVTKGLDRESLWVFDLRQRAMDAAAKYRRSRRRFGFDSPEAERAQRDVEAAWERYWWAYYEAPPGSVLYTVEGPDDHPYFFKFHIDGKQYIVPQRNRGRKAAQLVVLFTRFVAGRRIERFEPDKLFHMGILHDFGRLFDPPIHATRARLAQRFHIKASTVQYRLRRYKRLTADHS